VALGSDPGLESESEPRVGVYSVRLPACTEVHRRLQVPQQQQHPSGSVVLLQIPEAKQLTQQLTPQS
jgi:hypothetical protein